METVIIVALIAVGVADVLLAWHVWLQGRLLYEIDKLPKRMAGSLGGRPKKAAAQASSLGEISALVDLLDNPKVKSLMGNLGGGAPTQARKVKIEGKK